MNIDSQEEQDAIYAKAKEWTKGNVLFSRLIGLKLHIKKLLTLFS